MGSARTRAAIGSESALVFAADDGLALGLAVALRSALINLPPAVRPEIYVLDNGLSESSRTRVLSVVDSMGRRKDLRWTRVPADRFGHISTGSRITNATYARLLIPELCSEHVQRAVYLDADVLVRQDLSPLLTMELEGTPVGAVTDFLERRRPYFNAGVLVMDLALWRSTGIGERALQHATATQLEDNDQDALNAVIDCWHELDYKWNVQHGNLFFEGQWGLAERPPRTEFTDGLYCQRWDLVRRAAILHFVGGVKPWNRLCPLPGTTAWVGTMMQTNWYPRGQAVMWLLRYVESRTRYSLGTATRRLRATR